MNNPKNKTLKFKDFSSQMNLFAPIENATIEDSCEFINKGFQYDLILKNLIFKELISFKDCSFFKTLCFENCTFEKGIAFDSVKITDEFRIISSKASGDILFKDCTLSSFASIDTHYNEILFCGYLKNNAAKNGKITFENSFAKKLLFNDFDCYKPISLKEIHTDSLEIFRSTIYSEISFGYFEESKFFFAENVHIESSKFLQRFDFYAGSITKTLYIHKVEFEEQVVIRDEMDIDAIRFIEVRARYSVSIDFLENFESLEFSDCWFNTSLSVRCDKRLLSNSKKISITFTGVIYGNYLFGEIPTLSIELSCVNFGNIIFQDIETKLIILTSFFNYGKLFFNSIRYHDNYNVLVIFDSNIGNTEFENIDFRKFDEIVITKSDVSNLVLSNSVPPNKIQIKAKNHQLGYEVPLHEKIDDNIYYRDSYRQLKIAMEKIGNRYYSLLYKSREMYYHRKELKLSWDKILLTVNYLSNNNEISWTRGILFTLSCALIAFLLLNSQLIEPMYYWSFNVSANDAVNAFKTNFGRYITYLSTYPVLKIEGLNDNWIVDFIVLLSRIFISVGIYQTITAFRKYGK